ncbi:hypothetical protein Golax_011599, partial [Gossypium laxum]|nr:hypothetical protein [Gossypium laxum]
MGWFIQRAGYNNVLIYIDSLEVVKAFQDRHLAKLTSTLMASKRSMDVQVFVSPPEELVAYLGVNKV